MIPALKMSCESPFLSFIELAQVTVKEFGVIGRFLSILARFSSMLGGVLQENVNCVIAVKII